MLWYIKLRFRVNCENNYRLLREQLIKKDITRFLGGFVSLDDNKRIGGGSCLFFDECVACLSSFRSKIFTGNCIQNPVIT